MNNIKQKVDVRITKAIVEVFFDRNLICSHRRLYGRFGQYSTIENNIPSITNNTYNGTEIASET